MSREFKLAILVVTYNRKKFLEENIEAILGQTYSEFDFLIFDNASNDGTEKIVRKYCEIDSRIKYFNTGKNLGGAGGFNYGLDYVYREKYDYCWVMDDDAVPEKEALLKMVIKTHAVPEKSFSYLASLVLWTDRTPCYMNQTEIDQSQIYKYTHEIEKGLLPIFSSSFVGCFINLYYARKVGLPIKEFFLYGDDTEYTLRLGKCCQGFLNVESVIVHKMSINTKLGVSEAPEDRISRYIYDYRNQVYISRICKGEKKRVIMIKFVKECAKVLIRAKNKKIKRISVILKGYLQGRKFRPKIELKREKV